MGLQEVWFVIVGVLFLGFFILEGFDFGVGMLMAPLGRIAKGDPESHRRAVLNTIGPVWDGNEVWLIAAGRSDVRRLSRTGMPPCSRRCTCRCWSFCSQ